MRKLHNFEWKFIPQFHSRRSPEDQLNLRTSAAKQKLVHKAIATTSCDFFFDIEKALDDSGTTLRRFFLDQRIDENGPAVVLSVDRTADGVEYIFTTAQEHKDHMVSLVHFSPILLVRHFGDSGVRKILSVAGLQALEDQYWDEATQTPRSRFSDSLRDDHMDDRDIRIVIENISDLQPSGSNGLSRPPVWISTRSPKHHSTHKVRHARNKPDSIAPDPMRVLRYNVLKKKSAYRMRKSKLWNLNLLYLCHDYPPLNPPQKVSQ